MKSCHFIEYRYYMKIMLLSSALIFLVILHFRYGRNEVSVLKKIVFIFCLTTYVHNSLSSLYVQYSLEFYIWNTLWYSSAVIVIYRSCFVIVGAFNKSRSKSSESLNK